jgi:hypothetical protein
MLSVSVKDAAKSSVVLDFHKDYLMMHCNMAATMTAC